MTGLSTIYDGKKTRLQENETFIQLNAMEQKLNYQESNNFHLKECKLKKEKKIIIIIIIKFIFIYIIYIYLFIYLFKYLNYLNIDI